MELSKENKEKILKHTRNIEGRDLVPYTLMYEIYGLLDNESIKNIPFIIADSPNYNAFIIDKLILESL